jgi:hypothetical protein
MDLNGAFNAALREVPGYGNCLDCLTVDEQEPSAGTGGDGGSAISQAVVEAGPIDGRPGLKLRVTVVVI